MSDIFNNYDKGELSQNFKDSMNYNIYLDGLEKRNFDSEKEKTSESPENRLADCFESLANLLTMNKVSEMDASMVIDKKEENNASNDTQEKETETLPSNTTTNSSGSTNNEQASKDKSEEQAKEPILAENDANIAVHNCGISTGLLEKLESLFSFRMKYTNVDCIVKSTNAKVTEIKNFNTYLNGIFPDINELLKYLIYYKQKNTLNINEFELILFIYSIPNAYKYILDHDDKFGLANYIFAKKISNTGEPIWNETELKFIYKETKRMYEARNV